MFHVDVFIVLPAPPTPRQKKELTSKEKLVPMDPPASVAPPKHWFLSSLATAPSCSVGVLASKERSQKKCKGKGISIRQTLKQLNSFYETPCRGRG